MTLDAKLEVGAVTSTVEVAAADVAQIDTENATLSNVVEHTQMTNSRSSCAIPISSSSSVPASRNPTAKAASP